MKLGVLTLWTNGMSPTPALAPRASLKRDGVAALPKVARRDDVRGDDVRGDDVLALDAKPLFAVDDLAYAMPAAPPSKPSRRKPKAARSSAGSRKRSAPPRSGAQGRTHA
ncbi:MAG: hypothetical protein U0414_39385 [Polyangiaceae bacterium]